MSIFTIQKEYQKKGETYVLIKVNNDSFVSHATIKKDSQKYREMFGSSEVYTATRKFLIHPNTFDEKRYTSTYQFAYTDFNQFINTIVDIFERQKRTYKININFVFQLKNRITSEKRKLNKNLTEKPETITNKKTLKSYLKKIKAIDLVEKFSQDRPDSKFQFNKFVSYTIKLTILNSNIGAKIILPDFIKNSKSIIGLENYNDNLCFWRCLAIQLFNIKRVSNASTKARELFYQYYKNKDYKKYAGVNLSELPLIEEHYKININIFQFIATETSEIFIRSKNNYDQEINLNLYKNHFSLIKKIEKFIKNYNCVNCGSVFNDIKILSKHSKKCNKGETKFKFIGGIYKPNQNIFERIDKLGVYVDDELRYNPYFICYDFEAMLNKIDENQKNTKWTAQHVPISVSVCSNIPNFTNAVCIVNENNNLNEFINKFVQMLIKMSKSAGDILKVKYEQIYNKLVNIVDKKKKEKTQYKYKSIIKNLDDFIYQIPVIGFNSGKYDINLIKHNLFDALMQNKQGINFSVKRTNTFMCIATDNLKFLDILSYLAPGYSYDTFLKAFDCKLQKAVFCYEYLDNFHKLQDKQLPDYDKWFSKLKNKNISEEEYNNACKIWKDNNMKTLKDYLIYYNNLDVVPFVESIEKMKSFYKVKKLDMFKDAISIPGLSNKYMFNSADNAEFELFNEQNKDLFYLLKSNMCGGPSIIFNRYQERDITKIKNNKICKKIIGFDANALYLGCIGGEQPTKACIRYKPENSLNYYLDKIINGSLFGFVECDIHVTDELKAKFAEFPPIFKNAVISYNDLSDEMKKIKNDPNWKSKSLISSYFGNKILLYTPLIKFYLKHGLKITKIYQIMEYEKGTPFKNFVNQVCDSRRAGDSDPSKAIIAETMKLLGNSSFGRTILDKSKFNDIKYKKNENDILKSINSSFFKDLNEINDKCCEITSNKKKVILDIPIQIGSAIFQLAKLRMLEFVYNFLKIYVDDSDYQIIEMDTDSIYLSISADSFDSIIKPQMREQYEKEKHKWFVTNDYDKRTVSLFKIEYEGSGIVALNSKCYYCKGTYDKLSSKGCQKSNDLNFQDYKNVLLNGVNKMVTNRGFRTRFNKILSYEQEKVGLTPFYFKRKVLSDGINTVPLDL